VLQPLDFLFSLLYLFRLLLDNGFQPGRGDLLCHAPPLANPSKQCYAQPK
jgi:hypothetical protein